MQSDLMSLCIGGETRCLHLVFPIQQSGMMPPAAILNLYQLAIDNAINLPPEHSRPPNIFMLALIGKSERS